MHVLTIGITWVDNCNQRKKTLKLFIREWPSVCITSMFETCVCLCVNSKFNRGPKKGTSLVGSILYQHQLQLKTKLKKLKSGRQKISLSFCGFKEHPPVASVFGNTQWDNPQIYWALNDKKNYSEYFTRICIKLHKMQNHFLF